MAVWGRDPDSRSLVDESAAKCGLIPGVVPVYTQGENLVISTLFESIWPEGSTYNFLAAPDTLRVAAGGNVNDTAAGTNAQSVTLEMLDDEGVPFTEILPTNGALASVSTTGSAMRVNDAYVTPRGAGGYDPASAVNADIITIETTGGTIVGHIPQFRGKDQSAIYSIPKGYYGVLNHVTLSTDGNAIDAIICFREEFTNTTTPSAVRVISSWYGQTMIDQEYSVGKHIPPLSDIFFSAVKSNPVGNDARVGASFDLWLVLI